MLRVRPRSRPPPMRGDTNDCHRFGAVMEEFEVRDALNSVFSVKPELNMAF